ncbi:DNA-3-methyladenine glycosylase 2 family protein [Glaciihabitans sp. UYNi722]|uniref:DNA-3-methyladenine glycosylase family protein n=1 Tax=Glaciihabitans sp. UYNi722 TaxID=3156344 RepID=UPI003399FA3A
MGLALATDAEPLRTTYAPAAPLDLTLTLRPLSRGKQDPTMQWYPNGVWLTMPTPEGGATLHLSQRGALIDAVAWGVGAEWAIASVPELLGQSDESGDFDVSTNVFLHDAHRRTFGMRLLRTGRVFEMMVAAILEQKVTGKEARLAWSTLIRKHGQPAPGPAPAGMRVFPSPYAWRMIPSWEWHRAGVDSKRSRTVIAAASVATGLERTLALGRGGVDVLARLRSVPGVGVWTAAETSQRSHGDADAVSVGDYHLPAVVGWALIGKPVDDDGMLELLSPWPGNRQRVMRIIESSGFVKPRFGPRMAIPEHRSR